MSVLIRTEYIKNDSRSEWAINCISLQVKNWHEINVNRNDFYEKIRHVACDKWLNEILHK